MRIQATHPGFEMPTRGSDRAGAWDIYMPTAGTAYGNVQFINLGFAAEVPDNHVALLVPRSSIGAKFGVELNNTCGIIDSDYRGEWKAALRTKNGESYSWQKGDRLLQFLLVPVTQVQLELVESLQATNRGAGGFGSTGK